MATVSLLRAAAELRADLSAAGNTLYESPDVILMDMSLPVMDGWEATRRVKADAATSAIPVIALTAHALAEDREKAKAAGCSERDLGICQITKIFPGSATAVKT